MFVFIASSSFSHAYYSHLCTKTPRFCESAGFDGSVTSQAAFVFDDDDAKQSDAHLGYRVESYIATGLPAYKCMWSDIRNVLFLLAVVRCNGLCVYTRKTMQCILVQLKIAKRWRANDFSTK